MEERLKKDLEIPVFHDDQHGTAIIAGAALINGLELIGKDPGEIKVVFSGAGAAALATATHLVRLGVQRDNVLIIDSPPMAAGSDAFVLGAHAGNVILVLRSGSTHKDLAKGKMETFLRLPVRILGGVMNDIKEGEGDFGTYRYYSYYLPDYVTREDEPEELGEEPEPAEEPSTTVKA